MFCFGFVRRGLCFVYRVLCVVLFVCYAHYTWGCVMCFVCCALLVVSWMLGFFVVCRVLRVVCFVLCFLCCLSCVGYCVLCVLCCAVFGELCVSCFMSCVQRGVCCLFCVNLLYVVWHVFF